MHSIITLHDNMHVLYHSLHKGSKGSDGGFAVDYKKKARLEPQVGSKSYIRFRGLAPAAPFARYFRYCESASKEMVSKNFHLDKVNGPAL